MATPETPTRKDWNRLNELRQEQRSAVDKLEVLENDLTEAKLVTEVLRKVDPERRSFRQQGGVLVEKKVKDVIPALEKSMAQLEVMVNNAKNEINQKGQAIQSFMQEHNITLRDQLVNK